MADYVDQWSPQGDLNIFGTTVNVAEMHLKPVLPVQYTALWQPGFNHHLHRFTGTFTYDPEYACKIAGDCSCVFHVSARCVASYALNIFGDHSDVYACRQTGFAMLAETNPQGGYGLRPVAHFSFY